MKELVNLLIERNETISTMESCTGGYFASSITNINGSSDIFNFGAVTYSNEYKIKMGVNKEILNRYTVYSIEVAHEMSKCISNYTSSDYGIGITGKINRFDKNNLSGENNKVYASIYLRKENKYIDSIITCPLLERKEVKEYIVNEITKKLLELLK